VFSILEGSDVDPVAGRNIAGKGARGLSRTYVCIPRQGLQKSKNKF